MDTQEPIKILVVDDRPQNLAALASVLDRPDFEVVTKESGADALRFLLREDCAVILLDIQMPEMDGFEVARLVRGNERTRSIPIIFLTAINKESLHVTRGYKLGAVDYVFKPFDPEILRTKVGVFADLYAARRKLVQQAELIREHERSERLRALAELELRSLRREKIANTRYRNLVEGITHAIVWSAEPQTLLCTYVSPSAEKIIGRAPIEWRHGDFWNRHVHPDDFEPFTCAARSLRPGQETLIEHRLRTSSGEWAAFRTFLRVLRREEEESELELRGFSVDITEVRRADERFQFLARASSELFASLELPETARNITRLAVPFLADCCAIRIGEGDGATIATAFAHADPERSDEARAICARADAAARALGATTEPCVIDDPRRLIQADPQDPAISEAPAGELGGDGEPIAPRSIPSSIIVVPLFAGDQPFGSMQLVSFGQLDRAGGDRLAGAVTIAAEFGRRASQAIEKALLFAKVNDAIRVRDEFLSIASHELKTPMTPLQLQTQALARLVETEIAEGPLRDKLLKRLKTYERQIRRLDELVEQLLDIARLRSGRMTLNLEKVDLAQLVGEVVARFREIVEPANRRIVLAADESGALGGRWDRLRIDQVITNIVSNAVKYGGDGDIRVHLKRVGDRAVVAIADNGIGIAPAEQIRIFEPFERGAATKDYGGLGLGLHIVRQILEAHGGNISVTSEPGAGSVFTFSLPLAPVPGKGHGSELTLAVPGSRTADGRPS